MKIIHYELSNDDINAITYALEIMPSYNLQITEAEQNMIFMLSISCGKKLIMQQQLDAKEQHFIAFSINCAFKALRNEITIDDESISGLRPYMFIINKLQSVFSPLMHDLE